MAYVGNPNDTEKMILRQRFNSCDYVAQSYRAGTCFIHHVEL